jgi:exopolyphosphatase/guanosine-5'-triphosphate,3'-diphosphate pyrophosphatase
VVDIGGGSTEIIIGEGHSPILLESLRLGCVSHSNRMFAGGRLTARRFAQARVAAQQELETVQERYKAMGWTDAVGSAGTARAVFDALRELDPSCTVITHEGVEALVEQLVRAGHVSNLPFQSLSDERRAVLPGGLAVLAEVMTQLDIDQLRAAEGGLREGLLYDMLGRLTDEDARERTVRSMQRRYHVDLAQAARVEETAIGFLGQLREAWELDDPLAELALRWAARLHEIGLDVAHSGYHRHGAYLLQNADMPGFAREEQTLLARLVGAHRRKFSLEGLEDLIPPWDQRAIWMIVLLRLAVVLHRGRSASPLPEIHLEAKGRTLELHFRLPSLRNHPLTQADLQQEAEYLLAQKLRLRVFTS